MPSKNICSSQTSGEPSIHKLNKYITLLPFTFDDYGWGPLTTSYIYNSNNFPSITYPTIHQKF